MNVAMLVLNSFTHDARVHKEAKALADHGYRVIVIALWSAGLNVNETSSGYIIKRIKLYTASLKGRVIAPVLKYLEFFCRCTYFIWKQKVDVIHAHDANTLPVGWLASRIKKARLVYDAHELETGRNFGKFRLSGLFKILWPLPEKLFVRKASAVITVSESIAQKIADQYSIPKPTVIMNIPSLSSKEKSNLLREKLGIPDENKIVLYQGGITTGRGIETFILAIQKCNDVVGVAIGDGPMRTEYIKQLENGIIHNMYFPGRVPYEELLRYTSSADLGLVLIQNVCESYYLSLPNKLFEYMMAGIPVIGSNFPEICKIIKTLDIGEVIDPENPDELAQAIQRIFLDEQKYLYYQQNTIIGSTLYNWECETKKLLSLYEKIFNHEKTQQQ